MIAIIIGALSAIILLMALYIKYLWEFCEDLLTTISRLLTKGQNNSAQNGQRTTQVTETHIVERAE